MGRTLGQVRSKLPAARGTKIEARAAEITAEEMSSGVLPKAKSTATLTSKGRITIPKEIREKLRLKPGDRIHFMPLPDGTVRLMPQNLPITALKGMLGRPRRAVTVKEMNEAIGKALAEKHRRTVNRP